VSKVADGSRWRVGPTTLATAATPVGAVPTLVLPPLFSSGTAPEPARGSASFDFDNSEQLAVG